MKKMLFAGVMIIGLAQTISYGQGYMQFVGARSQVWDGFSNPGTFVLNSTVDVALMWAAANTTPDVDGLLTSTPVNSGTPITYTTAQAWNYILDGQFTLAQNASDNSSVITLCSSRGAIEYQTGAAFAMIGTTPGTTYTFYEVSWDATYSTPQTAALAGAAVGWSNPIQYEMNSQIQIPGSYTFSDYSTELGQFGAFAPSFAPIPEPGSLALVGLGGLSLLAARKLRV